MDKVYNAKVDEDFHKILKAYSAWVGSNLSEMTAEVMMMFMQQTAKCCKHTAVLMAENHVGPDPRRDKPCYGPACFVCANYVRCKAGSPLLLKLKPNYASMLHEEAAWMADLDGTSFPSTPAADVDLNFLD